MAKQSFHVFAFLETLAAPLVKQTFVSIKSAKIDMHIEQPEFVSMVCVLASYFQEDVSSFFDSFW